MTNIDQQIEHILSENDMPCFPDIAKEQGIDYTDYLTGAHTKIISTDPETGKQYVYTPKRNRQCSIGYHTECTDPQGLDCGCVCHLIKALFSEYETEIRANEREKVISRLELIEKP